ncbi:FAD/NAD(P)-binding protein [Cellulophaga baltica]|uniref:FAD/NAD(P)-binding protein n=1 Tax=Cellulophaga baltica TaxID=76594 RepID=UPI002147C95D|nr:FAD/NAD(P)-binding protein [Cellulophaga baltica]MCR1026105.1 FAD/NAD(P)-binding protein [Cellulophaga baltica]
MKQENKENRYDIGIIGCGPRGLSSLEALYAACKETEKKPKVIVFESTEFPGAGPVYNLQQPKTNWLNVSERGLAITPRKEIELRSFTVPSFPDFQNWSGYAEKQIPSTMVDTFPLRSELGRYLTERFDSIAKILIKENLLTIVQGEVDHIALENNGVRIEIIGGEAYRAGEVALCIGHQPVELDKQMTGWKNRVSEIDGSVLFTQPYPVSRIVESTGLIKGSNVAIRGFGLAMIDVARALTEGNGGRFEILNDNTREMKYVPSGREPNTIVPFSLNGLPMSPKPLNKKIDEFYVPSSTQLEAYELDLKKSLDKADELLSTNFLIGAIAPIIAEIFIAIGDDTRPHVLSESELVEVIHSWLVDAEYEHKLIVSKELPASKSLKLFVQMATGSAPVSLDYCIGHVWRHIQPTMYKLLSFAPISDELVGDIVLLDERLKRYSYGPPVDSLQQLLALIESGIINMDFIADPNIEMNENGWHFNMNGNTVDVDIMVNSVLDAPQILNVVSPLPSRLVQRSLIEPIHDKLGVRTRKDALMEIVGDTGTIPVAMMGRLAKGTLIGVDAIAECFGERPSFWANGFIERFR